MCVCVWGGGGGGGGGGAVELSYVGTYLVEEASHHVHADKPAQFNDCVRDILKIVDFGLDSPSRSDK